MNREILFRGKRVDNGEWIYGYPIFSEDYIFDYSERIDIPYVIPIDNFNLKDYREYRVIPETIGEYTGLTDKNGKKIFEGDILTSDEYPFKDDGEDNYIGIVYFYDNVPGFEYELRCINPKKRGISNGINNNFKPNDNLQVELEVIGNIFDKEVEE